MQEFISLTRQMTEIAGALALQYYRTGFDVDHKSDDSPVTIADREIERQVRDLIERTRPEDGFLGEEHGTKPSQNGLMWVVDPIDGTKSFVAGRPTYGTLIALWEGDAPLLGAIYQPNSQELWLGVQGQKTTLNGREIETKKTTDVNRLRIGTTSPRQFSPHPELLAALQETSDFFIWGGDCYLYGMLAFGGLDVVIETGLKAHDYAALPSIIGGAGGLCSDWRGGALTVTSEDTAVLCTANKQVENHVLDLIQKHA